MHAMIFKDSARFKVWKKVIVLNVGDLKVAYYAFVHLRLFIQFVLAIRSDQAVQDPSTYKPPQNLQLLTSVLLAGSYFVEKGL